MIACLILIGALVVAGILLRIFHRDDSLQAGEEVTDKGPAVDETREDCCGMHAVCEKINSARLESPQYYDDEELDRFAGRPDNDYSDDEIEEFRDVLYTLLPADVAGWGASLEGRGISLPVALRDDFMILLSDSRATRPGREVLEGTTGIG